MENAGSVTVYGNILRDSPSGKAVVFLWDHRALAAETVLLPKSQITVVHYQFKDKVTMPLWLAEKKGFMDLR